MGNRALHRRGSSDVVRPGMLWQMPLAYGSLVPKLGIAAIVVAYSAPR